MSDTFDLIVKLVSDDNAIVSEHAQLRLEEYGIDVAALVDTLACGIVIEDYPAYHAGPSVLVLIYMPSGEPVHSVWGIATGTREPAVLVTVYKPDPARWSPDFRNRMP